MKFKQFKSIVDQYPLNLLFNSIHFKEYQYVNPNVCKFLILKFSTAPNYIEVPYGFRYSKKEKHIVVIDKKHRQATTFLSYKHISNPSEKEVHTELTRIIKKLKKVQYNLKLENIKQDF